MGTQRERERESDGGWCLGSCLMREGDRLLLKLKFFI